MKTDSSVRIDIMKNRIYLTMVGFHDLAEATRMADLYIEAMQKCEPGFSVLVDVSQYKPGAAAIEPVHARVAHAAKAAKIGRVARVVGSSPLGGMQIDRIVRTETDREAKHFATREEAEAYLNE
jgi:hypothetical protein